MYQVPEEYEALLGSDSADLPFYLGLAKQARGEVLDLATGRGRVAMALAEAGVKACGLDVSRAMLDQARLLAQTRGLSVDWVQADLRDFHLGRSFALALLPYNGLQHLHSAAQLEAFFACLREHLPSGARFGLDVHLPQPALLARDPEEWFGVEEGPRTPQGWTVLAERSAYEPATQVLTQTWRLGGPDGASRDVALALRQFFPQELRALLGAQGFKVLQQAGSFGGEALVPGSLKQVVLAERC